MFDFNRFDIRSASMSLVKKCNVLSAVIDARDTQCGTQTYFENDISSSSLLTLSTNFLSSASSYNFCLATVKKLWYKQAGVGYLF